MYFLIKMAISLKSIRTISTLVIVVTSYLYFIVTLPIIDSFNPRFTISFQKIFKTVSYTNIQTEETSIGLCVPKFFEIILQGDLDVFCQGIIKSKTINPFVLIENVIYFVNTRKETINVQGVTTSRNMTIMVHNMEF